MIKKSDLYIENFLPADFFERIEKNDYIHFSYPKYSDRKAWEKVNDHPLTPLIFQEAEECLQKPLPQLLYSDYCQFNRNGNRRDYESPYFCRRTTLGIFTLALCISGDKQKYLPPLMDYLNAILEEWTWCLPAHMVWQENGAGKIRPTDLFASETAAVLATVYELVGDEIESAMNGITEHMRKTTLERTVYSVLYNKEFLPDNSWFTTKKPANWTIWCSFNNMAAAVAFEQDNKKLSKILRAFIRSSSRFAYCYDEDGYCDEGPGYYVSAGAMLFRVLDLLNKMQPGAADKLFKEPKIKAIFEFIANVIIGDYAVCFSDASPMATNLLLSCIIPCGIAIKSEKMLALGNNQKLQFTYRCGDLLRETLARLFDMPSAISSEDKGNISSFVCYPGRLAIIQDDPFSCTFKAGHNAEAHNHNDLGHFSLFCHKKPIIVDAGSAIYTKATFSAQRYTLWHIRGSGHNAPVFGDHEQLPGVNYKADFLKADTHEMICDLHRSYPAEAGIQKFIRSIQYEPDKVVVKDSFKLKKQLPASLTLLTTVTPEVKDGKVILDNVVLELKNLELKKIEKMTDLYQDPGTQAMWQGKLTAIRLFSDQNDYEMIFTYTGK